MMAIRSCSFCRREGERGEGREGGRERVGREEGVGVVYNTGLHMMSYNIMKKVVD